MRIFQRLLAFGSLMLILFGAVTAIAATNTVPVTRGDDLANSIALNNLKPSACAGINATELITGSGTITGTSGNDLILGSSGVDVIDGGGGNDCILGGGGADLITGNLGNDVCIGGPDTDVFTTCETQIQ